MVGNITNEIITVPTLFDLGPNEISHEVSLNELKHIHNDKKKEINLKSNAFYKKPCLIFSNLVSLKHTISAADTYAKK
ncbi:hypothetical protein T552_03003 [Pneumocystis carinii B80]|uniref:Uncharacterized protein n=1 Tax=Pneumocystis carinii (strain B80) TaxID=1408658 RepID=A0A0W4ZCI9_PNEC8|nr:hypothetical protein T552_03003 [Pneumocystis carinii B80]KTW26109.1 hypothetical protein T552_03003 [Pneumocystis carinii B80]